MYGNIARVILIAVFVMAALVAAIPGQQTQAMGVNQKPSIVEAVDSDFCELLKDAEKACSEGNWGACMIIILVMLYGPEEYDACFFSPQPGPDMVPIPDSAVVGKFLAWTPLYYLPHLDAPTDYNMEPGQSLWVFGVDASGQFYQVLLSGKLIWAPVESMGPNYDAVWNGTPLPTTVVE